MLTVHDCCLHCCTQLLSQASTQAAAEKGRETANRQSQQNYTIASSNLQRYNAQLQAKDQVNHKAAGLPHMSCWEGECNQAATGLPLWQGTEAGLAVQKSGVKLRTTQNQHAQCRHTEPKQATLHLQAFNVLQRQTAEQAAAAKHAVAQAAAAAAHCATLVQQCQQLEEAARQVSDENDR